MPSTDPEKRRQHSRDYYTRHREEQLTKAADYRDANREELARKQWVYYQTNKEAILARRRARKTERKSND